MIVFAYGVGCILDARMCYTVSLHTRVRPLLHTYPARTVIGTGHSRGSRSSEDTNPRLLAMPRAAFATEPILTLLSLS